MTEEKQEWKFPQLTRGDRIIHYGDATKSDANFGFVLRPKSRSATVILFHENGGFEVRRDCWHIDDPWSLEKPEAYRDVLDPTRGLFEVAPGEIREREIATRLTVLEANIEKLALAMHKATKG